MSLRYPLWAVHANGGIRIKRYVLMDEAAKLVENDKADVVLHKVTGVVVALKLKHSPLKPEIAARPAFVVKNPSPQGAERPAKASCTAFSRAEVEAIAGIHGESRTMHLSEDQKADRIRRKWLAEDLVESAQQKLAVYNKVH
jgi:hypothetical protein